MSGKRYTATEKRRLTAAAERLRDKGLLLREVAPLVGVHPKTLWRWVRPRHAHKPARVAYDPPADCWRIYVYDPQGEDDQQRGVDWWPLSWMQFATEDCAQAHLDAAGEYEAAA